LSLCVPKVYKRRNPENTLLYQIVQNYLEDWLANYYIKNNERLPGYVENEYRDYFKCGILCHGFARARCDCGTDFIIAFSCKRRGVCPSCNSNTYSFRGSAEIARAAMGFISAKMDSLLPSSRFFAGK